MNQSPVIQLHNVRKSFGPLVAVNDVNLTIGAGEVVALLGANGAGKSTTIDIALGLARPNRGAAQLFGDEPRRAVETGRVGAMLQGGALLPTMTVWEAVSLVASVHKHPLTVRDALERARCTEIAKQKVSKLSGGQMQRARFAVAVVSNPDLLILDEPTAAMDVEARRVFWQSMQKFTDEGRTVVFATHYLDEADTYADRIVMLSAGSVVADGTPAQVKAVVSGRRIRANFDDSIDGEFVTSIETLPEVTGVERRAGQVTIVSNDSDVTLRHLLAAHPHMHDIEIVPHTMDDAFLALTHGSSVSDRSDNIARSEKIGVGA